MPVAIHTIQMGIFLFVSFIIDPCLVSGPTIGA